MFSGLTLPLDGKSPIGELYASYLKSACSAWLALAPGLGEGSRALAVCVRRALLRQPNATLACFASPTVATPIRCAALRDDLPELRARIDGALARVGPHLALELATRRLFSDGEALTWPDPIGRLASLPLGIAITPPRDAPLRFSSGALDAGSGRSLLLSPGAVAAGFTIEPAYVPIGTLTRLALYDGNPIAALEAHPEKEGNALDLGGRDPQAWCAALDGALRVVVAHLPELTVELKLLLHEIVPVGWHAERHLSASYREAIGTIYLTLHPSEMTLAEAIVHELSHNKLNLASHAAPLLDNAFAPLFPSPLRPDPRPLWGILLAVHAFLPVAVLYRRMRATLPPASLPMHEQRLGEIDLKNHEGMEMLRAHARFTGEGRPLFGELDALDRAHMAERSARSLDLSPTGAHD